KKYPQDFCRLDNFMHQLKGSASRCLRSFQKVKKEHAVLKQKLENYFQVRILAKKLYIILTSISSNLSSSSHFCCASC
ncbi:hypothetical protein GW17_00056797, partial [Ensete ventricosum]